jgi:hypothetical protein
VVFPWAPPTLPQDTLQSKTSTCHSYAELARVVSDSFSCTFLRLPPPIRLHSVRSALKLKRPSRGPQRPKL